MTLRAVTRQKNFHFTKQFVKSYPKDSIPIAYLRHLDQFKAAMLKQGYVVKDVSQVETLTIRCTAARANMSLSEREKLQEQIDKMPVSKVFKIMRP